MLKTFKIGDKVNLINEAIGGKIISIQAQKAMLLLDDGFEEEISFHRLIHVSSGNEINQIAKLEKHQDQYIEIVQEQVIEIDLHIENIKFDWKKMEKNKILPFQISYFKEELRKAISISAHRLIVIHGKGTGILKNSVLDELKNYPNLKYNSLSKGKYNQAAIEIYLQ